MGTVVDKAYDTETALIAPGIKAPLLICGTYCTAVGSPGIFHRDDPAFRAHVEKSLAKDRIVGANISYDMGVFAQHWPDLLPKIFEAYDDDRIICIQAAEKLHDIRLGCFRLQEDEAGDMKRVGYSLADLSLRKLGRQMEKDKWRMSYHDFYATPIPEWPAGAVGYASGDATDTLEIWEKQRDYPYSSYLPSICRHDFALHLAAARGLRTDPLQVARVKAETQIAVEELEQLLSEGTKKDAWIYKNDAVACGWSKRPKIIKAYLHSLPPEFERTWTPKGIEMISSGKLHEVEAAEGAFLSLAFSALEHIGDDKLEAFAKWNKLTNLLNTTIKQMEAGRTVPIQTRFDSLLATTRTSSSGPNIQNVRRVAGIRECYISRPGYAFVACDYSAAELHTLAQVCYDEFQISKLGDALNEGIDVHCRVGSRLIGIEYAEMMERVAEGEARAEEARQIAKGANFGFPGGCGPERYASMVSAASAASATSGASGGRICLDIREATRIKAQWMSEWVEMDLFFKWVNNCKMPNSPLHFCYLPRLDIVRGGCTFPAACNTNFQGLAAAGAKNALWQLTKDAFDPKSVFYGCRPVNFIHDEIICEVPLWKLHEASLHQKRVMEEQFNHYVPDCPTKCVLTAMFAWSKKAKAIYDAPGGKLIPWEGREQGTVYKVNGDVWQNKAA